MSKAKLEAARELITDKHYAEARALLRTMSTDPTAQRWLAKLDSLIPPVPTPEIPLPPPSAFIASAAPPRPFVVPRRRNAISTALVLLVVAAVIFGGLLYARAKTEQGAAELRDDLRLIRYCVFTLSPVRNYTSDQLVTACGDWMSLMKTYFAEETAECGRRAPEVDVLFYACMSSAGVVPIIPPYPEADTQ